MERGVDPFHTCCHRLCTRIYARRICLSTTYLCRDLPEGVLIAIGLAQKSLRDAALYVYRPLVGKIYRKHVQKLSWIVGRDTEKLEESGIARGAIETVSENTADGITSPLFWAFLLGHRGYGCTKR